MKNQIKNFDRAAVKSLRSEIDMALATLSKKYGIEISTGNASFTGSNVTFKVQAAVKASNGIVMTKEASDFARYASTLLPGVKIGDTVSIQGNEYVIAGWKTRAQKNPVIVTRNGKSYRVTASMIRFSSVNSVK